MPQRQVEFTHDGHAFVASEEVAPAAGDLPASYRWRVTMDGTEVLEFTGDYPYRDPDVTRRVLEWYGIQKPA